MPDNTTFAARRPKTRPSQRRDEPELFRRHHHRLLRLVARDTGAAPALVREAISERGGAMSIRGSAVRPQGERRIPP